MGYTKYNKIPTFDECKQIVNDCSAFSHSTQEFKNETIHSFKYNLNMPGMWEGDGRLNLRGITFDSKGNLLALAFPKFFNKGEDKDTLDRELLHAAKFIEKIDGSLISMFMLNGEVQCKTMKSVLSDVAIECRDYLKRRKDIVSFCKNLLRQDLSPLFEFVSKESRIVLDYGGTDLYFLGARNMKTGEIISFDMFELTSEIKTPRLFTDVKTANIFLSRDDVEGIVVTYADGYMMKFKTERYCKIHKILDGFMPKKVVNEIINGTLDDMIGVLTDHGLTEEKVFVDEVAKYFWARFNAVLDAVKINYEENKHLTRKDIALKFVNKNASESDKLIGKMLFLMIDGKDVTDVIYKKLKEESKTWEF